MSFIAAADTALLSSSIRERASLTDDFSLDHFVANAVQVSKAFEDGEPFPRKTDFQEHCECERVGSNLCFERRQCGLQRFLFLGSLLGHLLDDTG
jgi:hypothetical protein